jgi:hypothetical protein
MAGLPELGQTRAIGQAEQRLVVFDQGHENSTIRRVVPVVQMVSGNQTRPDERRCALPGCKRVFCESFPTLIVYARHGECCFERMAMLLISWVSASVVVCLAFLSAAARPMPRFEEQMVPGSETGPRREGNFLSEDRRLAPPPSERALPSSCPAA